MTIQMYFKSLTPRAEQLPLR